MLMTSTSETDINRLHCVSLLAMANLKFTHTIVIPNSSRLEGHVTCNSPAREWCTSTRASFPLLAGSSCLRTLDLSSPFPALGFRALLFPPDVLFLKRTHQTTASPLHSRMLSTKTHCRICGRRRQQHVGIKHHEHSGTRSTRVRSQ